MKEKGVRRFRSKAIGGTGAGYGAIDCTGAGVPVAFTVAVRLNKAGSGLLSMPRARQTANFHLHQPLSGDGG